MKNLNIKLQALKYKYIDYLLINTFRFYLLNNRENKKLNFILY